MKSIVTAEYSKLNYFHSYLSMLSADDRLRIAICHYSTSQNVVIITNVTRHTKCIY